MKKQKIGANNTSFVTPNGLDAKNIIPQPMIWQKLEPMP